MTTCYMKGVVHGDKPTDNYYPTPLQSILALFSLFWLFPVTAGSCSVLEKAFLVTNNSFSN